jgi:hypothetical protein
MTATEIIYAVREKLKAYSDDSRYTDSYLMYLINLKRAVYIRREYNQLQRTFDTDVTQSFCMELEEVDASVCPECATSQDCTIIRTKEKLPNTIELHSRGSIVKVSPVGIYDRPFSIISINKMPYAGEGRYENKYVFVALHPNGHLYFKSESSSYRGLQYVSVTALIENPDDILNFECNSNTCYDPDRDHYPAEAWMVDIIISDIVRELANLKQLPEDKNNDANETNREAVQ